MTDPDDIQVLIPAHGELALVGLTDLLEKIQHGNYSTLEEAIDDASIDTVEIPTLRGPGSHVIADQELLEDLADHLRRIGQLNETGDAAAYWNH